MRFLIHILIINPIFWILSIFTMGMIYTPTDYRWYRKWHGGKWYNYSPRMYPYMSFWTQDKDSLAEHEILCEEEEYPNPFREDILDN